MRSRLTFTLSAWLIGAVAVSVLALGGFTSWNLSQGFTAYLRARDLERLDKFVALVAQRMAEQSSSADGNTSAPDMSALLREMAIGEGLRTPPPPERPDRPAPHGGPDDGRDGPRMPPPHQDGDGFGNRVALAWPDGRLWVGPPISPSDSGVIERPVKVGEKTVALAWLRLRPLPQVPNAIEGQFLRQQFLGIGRVVAALLLLALIAAIWLSRQWIRPLLAVQDATSRIARGELSVRVPTDRSDEIGDVMRNVNTMAESLQRIDGARRRWMADLSHELRTPLSVVRGEIEALMDGVRPLTKEAMASLQEETLRLGSLVDDLHLLAMADLQSLPCQFEEADVTEIATRVMRHHALAADDAALSLTWANGQPAAAPARCDPRRIEQVLNNLVQNSLRYTDAPGRITMDIKTTADCIQIEVEDSAPGLAPHDMHRIFEPLFRADDGRSRHNGGSGLGLAISAAIVQAHDGLISVHPSALGGLRFEVDLPTQPEPMK